MLAVILHCSFRHFNRFSGSGCRLPLVLVWIAFLLFTFPTIPCPLILASWDEKTISILGSRNSFFGVRFSAVSSPPFLEISFEGVLSVWKHIILKACPSLRETLLSPALELSFTGSRKWCSSVLSYGHLLREQQTTFLLVQQEKL